MRIRLLCMLAVVASCASVPETTLDAAGAHAVAMEVLEGAARAWNRGDLEAFVSDYPEDRRAAFVTREGVLHGRAAIRERYVPRFSAAVRDSLSFENVEADALAPDVVHVTAWYRLMRGDSLVARAPTSLVLIRGEGRWLILKDHTG